MSRACCCCCTPKVESECFKAPVIKTHEVCWYKTPVIKPICGGAMYGGSYGAEKNCSCNFSVLVILILIILQFGKKSHHEEEEECYKPAGIDNGILFIIAIFYLVCSNPCK